MKKLFALILAAAMLFCFVGCDLFSGDGDEEKTEATEYTVKFKLDGGTLVSGKAKQYVEKGEDAKPPKVEREGYEFDGWNGDYKDIDEDTTLTAKWKKLITVTFVLGGELEDVVLQVKEGEMPEAPEVEREGYEFDGWDREIAEASEDTSYTAKWKATKMDAEQIYEVASKCVAEITVYDINDSAIASGTGFFIDDNGLVVTNYHVIEGAYSAELATPDNREYEVEYIVDYSADYDIALIKVDISGNDYLEISPDTAKTGDKIYTLGSTLGMSGTLSDGLISTASRTVDGKEYIQITAPISSGNSGGPLLDEFARVIGINTWTRTDGQNVNFAIPIKTIDMLSRDGSILFSTFGAQTSNTEASEVDYTDGFFSQLDSEDWEVEYNGSAELADKLYEDEYRAAAVADSDDLDAYSIELTEDCNITLEFVPYYIEDDDKYSYFICDENGEWVIADNTNFVYGTDEDGLYYASIMLDLSAGKYYFAVYGADTSGFPYYYAVKWHYEND